MKTSELKKELQSLTDRLIENWVRTDEKIAQAPRFGALYLILQERQEGISNCFFDMIHLHLLLGSDFADAENDRWLAQTRNRHLQATKAEGKD